MKHTHEQLKAAPRFALDRRHAGRMSAPDDVESTTPGPTILVVDDDPRNLKLARVLLEAEGYDVRLAVDAVSMFEELKSCEPALILMDIQLPGIDGWELIGRLKRNFATRRIPIVALTAYAMKGEAEHAKALGCEEYVAKPISTEQLPAIVKRHLAGSSSTRK